MGKINRKIRLFRVFGFKTATKALIVNSIISIEQMFVNEKKNKFSYYFLEILFIRFHKKLHTIHISDIYSNPLFATQLTKIKSSYLPLFPLAPPCEEKHCPQHHRAIRTRNPPAAPPRTQHPAHAPRSRTTAHAAPSTRTPLTQYRPRNAHAPQTQKSAAYATLFLFIFT